jgi:hypothetical protein
MDHIRKSLLHQHAMLTLSSLLEMDNRDKRRFYTRLRSIPLGETGNILFHEFQSSTLGEICTSHVLMAAGKEDKKMVDEALLRFKSARKQ